MNRRDSKAGRNSKLLKPIQTGKSIIGLKKDNLNNNLEINKIQNQANINTGTNLRNEKKMLETSETLHNVNVNDINKKS